MFQERYPHFERDIILKAEMLTNLKEYPRDMFHLLFCDYSEGIISGAKVKVKDHELVISPGIIKWENYLYHMEEEVKISYEATGKKTCLKLRFLKDYKKNDFTTFDTEIVLDEDRELKADEIELCRFTLMTGAILRQDYQDLSDFATEHNTLNILYVKYAGVKEPTISPEITYYFGKELLKYNPENPYDVSFGMLCLQEKHIDREVIQLYLMARLNISDKERLSNGQIHKCFVQVLENVRSGKSGMSRGDNRVRRMIVE